MLKIALSGQNWAYSGVFSPHLTYSACELLISIFGEFEDPPQNLHAVLGLVFPWQYFCLFVVGGEEGGFFGIELKTNVFEGLNGFVQHLFGTFWCLGEEHNVIDENHVRDFFTGNFTSVPPTLPGFPQRIELGIQGANKEQTAFRGTL